MKIKFFSIIAILSFLFFSCNKDDDSDSVMEITIPAGSVDELAAAIDEIEPNGVITLAAGEHCENESITIDKTIKLIGEDGAVLIVDTGPTYDFGETLDPAIHVKNAPGTIIENIELLPKEEIGGTAIIFEESDGSVLRGCTITKHQYIVVSQLSDEVIIDGNYMECTDAWKPYLDPNAEIIEAIGITIVNGQNVHIQNNEIKGGVIGVWVCDDTGTVENNTVLQNYIGVIPCAVVAESAMMLPGSGGVVIKANVPGNNWTIKDNHIHDNDWFGILLFDASFNCHVENNDCTGNGVAEVVPYNVDSLGIPEFLGTGADIEVGGESNVFGYTTFGTFDNTIIVGPGNSGVRVKDCGMNSTIDLSGGAGIKLDTSAFKCF